MRKTKITVYIKSDVNTSTKWEYLKLIWQKRASSIGKYLLQKALMQ